MADKELPRPVTVSDIYLHDIAVNTRLIRDYLAPKPEVVLATPIPDGFPGRDALIAAGVESLEAIPQKGADLVKIKGIGNKTASEIITFRKVHGL